MVYNLPTITFLAHIPDLHVDHVGGEAQKNILLGHQARTILWCVQRGNGSKSRLHLSNSATRLIFILLTTVDTFMMIKNYCTIGTTGPDEMNLTKPLKNGFELSSE